MQFYSNNVGTKFYFVRNPGGNPNDIELQFNGATAVNVTPSGGLDLVTTLGTISFEAGHAYAINPSGNIVPMPWQAKFVQVNANTVKFDIHQFPQWMPLIIQVDRGHELPPPAVPNPVWSTYFGGNGADVSNDVTVDNLGNPYIAGWTQSIVFPIFNGYQPVFGGIRDVFVAKFLGTDLRQEWTTYYGGSKEDEANAIAWANISGGRIYFTGYTASNWSTPTFPTVILPGAYNQPNTTAPRHTFLVRLDAATGIPDWATNFGLDYDSRGYGLAVDPLTNDVYMVGVTHSDPSTVGNCAVPTTLGEFPLCNPGGGAYFINYFLSGNFLLYDGFIAKFNSLGELKWSTYFPSNADDWIFDIALDQYNIYITGFVEAGLAPSWNSSWLMNPGLPAYYQSTPGGPTDAFVARFSTATNQLLWGTLIGGGNEDYARRIAMRRTGTTSKIYISGSTNTPTTGSPSCATPTNNGFPNCIQGNSFSDPYTPGGSGFEDFIVKFVNDDVLDWSTWIGGNGDEGLFPTMDLDINNTLYISGSSESPLCSTCFTFPVYTNWGMNYNVAQNTDAASNNFGISDCYIAAFKNTNEILWSTYFGGKGYWNSFSQIGDESMSLAAFSNQALYITGYTYSTSQFPLACPFPGTSYCQGATTVSSANSDAFIAKFDISQILSEVKEEQNAINFVIYPNPSTGSFSIEWGSMQNESFTIHLYNIIGQTLFKKPFLNPSLTHRININNLVLSAGIYMVTLSQGEKLTSQKIIIQK